MQPAERSLLAPLVAAALLLPSTLCAQIGGRVVDSAGTPLNGAVVELWGTLQRLATKRSGIAGTFEFDRAESDSARVLFVRLIGYQAIRTPVIPGSGPLSVTLLPTPLRLPELQVGRAPRLCPSGDEPHARALMQAAAIRYRVPFDRSLQADLEIAEETVAAHSLGEWSPSLVKRGLVQVDGQARKNWETMLIPQHGYALPNRVEVGGLTTAKWTYMPLAAGMADHFVHPVFLERHHFFLWRESGAGTEIGFCPKDRSVPEIQGVLTFAADGSPAAAAWSFITPSDNEHAGGELRFLPSASFLLPEFGVSWRRLTRDSYAQEAWVYQRWVPTPSQ